MSKYVSLKSVSKAASIAALFFSLNANAGIIFKPTDGGTTTGGTSQPCGLGEHEINECLRTDLKGDYEITNLLGGDNGGTVENCKIPDRYDFDQECSLVYQTSQNQ